MTSWIEEPASKVLTFKDLGALLYHRLYRFVRGKEAKKELRQAALQNPKPKATPQSLLLKHSRDVMSDGSRAFYTLPAGLLAAAPLQTVTTALHGDGQETRLCFS